MRKLFAIAVLLSSCAHQKPAAVVHTGGYTARGKVFEGRAMHAAMKTPDNTVKQNPKNFYTKNKPVRLRTPGYLPAYNF